MKFYTPAARKHFESIDFVTDKAAAEQDVSPDRPKTPSGVSDLDLSPDLNISFSKYF